MTDRIDLIKQMLLKEPDDAFLNYALALELIKKNELQEATLILDATLKRDENYLAAYYQLGKLFEQMDRKEKANDTYRKGVEIAKKQKNTKTLGELSKALSQL